jgi:metallo-beta-lactamase family protein
MTGYCEPQSLGARLQLGTGEVSIYGKIFPIRATIDAIRSLSAHGDYEDLCQWLACQDPAIVKKLFLVHGEYDVQLRFRERLMHKGFKDVVVPARHEVIGVG